MPVTIHPKGTPLPANSPLNGNQVIVGYFKPPSVVKTEPVQQLIPADENKPPSGSQPLLSQ